VGAVTLAAYFLLAEQGVARRDVVSLACWGFFFATLFWSVLQPWWSFPFGDLAEQASLSGNLDETTLPVWVLALWMIVLGTIAPFLLLIGALKHLPATRVGIVATAEPVVATIAAWAWLGETLGAAQLVGGAVVLAGIALAQTAR
jgi:drug/metabolite transporter (DMT)-like permease